ncbi:proteasome subunit beta type-4-like [Drosophila obscura]|uniref:proteasome subunit beta type-4-like n=1 Tax=Drosophila obscura TaxID=7282 RepID=UPI001BB1F6F2|nr:proteasome subunit beta type-4-like [Drosophila obscura]
MNYHQYYQRASSERPELLKLIGTDKDEESIPWGSTVLGLRYDRGVLIAAETCAHSEWMPRFQNMDRVFKISEQIIVGGGGDFGGIQKYKDTIDAQVIADRIYWAAFEMKPKTEDHTAVLIVVGGMDPKTGPYLSSIDCRGRIVEDYVVTTGPALEAVLPMVRNNKPKDREFSEQEALAMIWKGMTGALHCPDAREIPSYTVGICSANGCHIEGPYRANKDWTHARHNEVML